MIKCIDRDVAALDLAELQAVQFSARQALVSIAPYLERLHSKRDDLQAFQLDGLLFYAVELVGGVLVDPALPTGFDDTAHQQRDDVERARWWNRPFIERSTWDGPYGLEASHRAGKAALAQVFPELAVRDVDECIAVLRGHWFSDWPGGVRYEVRCIDGAAPDRATNWGTFASMTEALDCAVHGWRY